MKTNNHGKDLIVIGIIGIVAIFAILAMTMNTELLRQISHEMENLVGQAYKKNVSVQITDERPNIVVIIADDMSSQELWVMKNVMNLISYEGVNFTRFFVSYSLCCPSRATFLTGQYSQNNGVRGNYPPTGGYTALDHSNTLAVWLQNSGYYTAHIGKYLNGYGQLVPPETIPPGWTEWYGAVDPTTYYMYGYMLNENGVLRKYGSSEQEYQTDVYTNKAVKFIEQFENKSKPFFLTVAYLAPHVESPAFENFSHTEPFGQQLSNNPRAAQRHEGTFKNLPLPKKPSFNENDVSDKPVPIKFLPAIGSIEEDYITDSYRSRLEALLSVDEGVEKIFNVLSKIGKLNNTVVIFWSDNGYLHGEHRIPGGKGYIYEESINVPLIIRGPKLPKNKIINKMVANIDLAPTIAELASASPSRVMDGRSLIPLIMNPSTKWRSDLLIENYDADMSAVRTEDYVFGEFAGKIELTELYKFKTDKCHEADPYELESQHMNRCYDSLIKKLRHRLNVLRTCSGTQCW